MSYEFDAALVLACGINEDGSLPADPKESVDIAKSLYDSARTPLVIFSGNISYKATSTPPRSESTAMREYAQETGLPIDCLLQEDVSKDTLGNVYFTKVSLLIPRKLGRLAVVLGPNHSRKRVQYILDKVLGSQYQTTLFEHSANRAQETEREKKSLNILRQWFDQVPNGDHEAVYQIMLDRHPGYKTSR